MPIERADEFRVEKSGIIHAGYQNRWA